ncbi:palmitoyltransferase ZDHHC23 isoform X3 [Strix uralensis]|uniref:palmitoyltransferase ZDHHC23 isoform X3 n=1 Tax=Strix uralensis TaxID=36305 RepID=UPI003DA74B13
MEEPLCCCEYVDRRGERNHLAACCCDCEDLDEGCERWLTCKSLPPGALERIADTVADRVRVPWFAGAVKIKEVVPRGHVGHSQVVALTGGLVLMLAALSRAKKDPGYLPIPASDEKSSQRGLPNKGVRGSSNGLHGITPSGAAGGRAVNGETKGYSRVSAEEPEGVKKDWCTKCQLVRPARAGHCRLCGRCVRRLDHHCVWINSCVGEQNHQAFILALSFFMLTSVYGITLTLHTVCRGRTPFVALFYCPGAYSDYSSALSFTCVWYCAIVTAGMGYILLIQLLNISYNVTEREARLALRDNTGRRLLGGLVIDTGQYNRGFLCNWGHFLSLGSSPPQRSAEDIV